ncbi:helix-turn-helix transcriptional regulator [Tsukamurella tyrosinosolvens]|uniref:helix-turn-helix transcriptional regulator n=1 Tax=Tsukamurella tyrosinosolvens TaxID=57704 RepID=UPI003463728E
MPSESKRSPFSDLLTTAQVCELYPFLSPATMRVRRHRGEEPASFVVNGRVLYRRAEIDRWLAKQEAATTRGGTAA